MKQFNQQFHLNLKLHHFKDIYLVNDVTRKFIQPRLGRPQLKPRNVQELELLIVKQKWEAAQREGYECIILDECLF